MSEKPPIRNTERNMQFEYNEGDNMAKLEYRFLKDNIAFMHTFVPDVMKGKGIATMLAQQAFDYARSINKKVIVYCPFVAIYVKRHPEVNDLLARDIS